MSFATFPDFSLNIKSFISEVDLLFSYNLLQNVLRKVNKLSITGKDQFQTFIYGLRAGH